MTGRTHFALGLFTGIICNHYIQADSYTIVSACCIGSLLPDIDTQKSTLSKMVLPASKIIDAVTKHRGFTHNILPFLMMLVGWWFSIHWLFFMGIGAFTHFLADSIGIKCDSTLERVIYYLVWVSVIGLQTYFFYNYIKTL